MHYDDNADGRWITIGAQKSTVSTKGGSKEVSSGGSPVFIKGGKITKGAPGLKGKKLSELDKNKKPGTEGAGKEKAEDA